MLSQRKYFRCGREEIGCFAHFLSATPWQTVSGPSLQLKCPLGVRHLPALAHRLLKGAVSGFCAAPVAAILQVLDQCVCSLDPKKYKRGQAAVQSSAVCVLVSVTSSVTRPGKSAAHTLPCFCSLTEVAVCAVLQLSFRFCWQE